MKILIVSATSKEYKLDYPHIISGVGMVSTSISVTKEIIRNKYDLVINAGIAGSFRKDIELGSVVEVVKDQISEIGAQSRDDFLSPSQIGLDVQNIIEMPSKTNFQSVSGITVNTVHGNNHSINQIIKRLNPDIETMEGAACMIACKNMGVPCVQIRSISNYIEERNKSNWKIDFAIENLNSELNKFIKIL